MKKKFFLFLFLLPTFVGAQTDTRPRLIVEIIVDQMSYDQFVKYLPRFTDSGFKKFINQGAFCKNFHYDYLNINSASGIATLSTGVYPSGNGIVNKSWYSVTAKKDIYCVYDQEEHGMNTFFGPGKSPKNLDALTWTDEIRLNTYKLSNVYSVSLNDYAAILAGGKLADGAYWFDATKGEWTSSSYYFDSLEVWVKNYNDKKFADIYLNRTWTTSLPINEYKEALSDANSYEEGFDGKHTFPYNLQSLKNQYGGYELLKYTPFGNTFTKDFAITLMMKKYLGKDDFTDVLIVDFASTAYIGEKFGIQSIELEDAYIKLDKDIAHLISVVEDFVGKDNVLFVVTSDRGACNNQAWQNAINLETGIFNPVRANVILNSYLKALYGARNWVDGFHNNELYFNHEEIDKQGKSLIEMQEKSAEILTEMRGISSVIPTAMIKNGTFGSSLLQQAKNSFYQGRSGDLFVVLNYGWKFKGEIENNSGCCSPYNENTHVPLLFYGKNIPHKTIIDRYSANDLAVTMAFLLGIPLPNKATGQPVKDLIKK